MLLSYKQLINFTLLKMSAFRMNSKKAKGHIETSDSQLIKPKEGEGIGDIQQSF